MIIPYIIRIAIYFRAYEFFFFFSEFKCPVEILTGKLWPGYGSFAEATVQQFKVDQLNANISYYVFIDLSASTICFYIMEFLTELV